MEVDAAIEIFKRSEEFYNVKYSSYVGDGDCKTFKGITESHPYGDDFSIIKKECVGHVQKRMGAMIWSFAPKRVFSGAKTVEVASYFAASIFNHGYESILQMMSVLNLQIGPNAVEMCDKADELRISVADKRSFETSKEGRIERRTARSALEEDFHEQEGSLYDVGMSD
ncbi:uncharacterized protein [Temnothorax nylanderi]|uniref:uncharacterized protein n=1 Tax=Temnothorax nylanderi TaxID=102681 RepID=UPI003A8B99E0